VVMGLVQGNNQLVTAGAMPPLSRGFVRPDLF
jgi:hypothetical protein